MRKFLSALLCAFLSVSVALGLSACGNKKDYISVYTPDGAPALALAKLMHEENSFGGKTEYEVVDPSVIAGFVTGENPKADICVLPVNLASKLLGTGEKYKMLGTVTHGNLFILKKQGVEDITVENMSILTGKVVGVIQLTNVPGLTFKAVLRSNGLEYSELGNADSVDETKVNLKAVSHEQVAPSDKSCDYYVVPEPAATLKVNASKGALSFAGSLQTLYGEEGGYPQAVIVAKSSLIENNPEFIARFIAAVSESAEWLLFETTSAEMIVTAVQRHLTYGLKPSFTVANLSEEVIKNCAVKFVGSKDCKVEVNAFLDKLIAVNLSSASVVSDGFFYIENKS